MKASWLLEMKIYFVSWHLIKAAFFSFNFHPTASCQFLLHAHLQKHTSSSLQPKKKQPQTRVFILLLSLSPSVLLLLLWPSVVLLFSLHGIASRITTSGTVRGAILTVDGWWERRRSDICQLGEKNGLAEALLKIKSSSRRKSKTKTFHEAKEMALCIYFYILRNLNSKMCS